MRRGAWTRRGRRRRAEPGGQGPGSEPLGAYQNISFMQNTDPPDLRNSLVSSSTGSYPPARSSSFVSVQPCWIRTWAAVGRVRVAGEQRPRLVLRRLERPPEVRADGVYALLGERAGVVERRLLVERAEARVEVVEVRVGQLERDDGEAERVGEALVDLAVGPVAVAAPEQVAAGVPDRVAHALEVAGQVGVEPADLVALAAEEPLVVLDLGLALRRRASGSGPRPARRRASGRGASGWRRTPCRAGQAHRPPRPRPSPTRCRRRGRPPTGRARGPGRRRPRCPPCGG